MFSKIELHNFKCFKDISFELGKNEASPNNLLVIYGENGVGKSNLLSAFTFLRDLMDTMDFRLFYERILSDSVDSNSITDLKQYISSGLKDIQMMIDAYGMIDREGPISVRYDFVIEQKTGTYIIELGDHGILKEKLEYVITERKGVYFECSNEGININPSIVSKEFLPVIKDEAKKYWGKHSMLSIIQHQVVDKSDNYIRNNFSVNLHEILNRLNNISCLVKTGDLKWDNLYSPLEVLDDPISGVIPRNSESQLDIAEGIISLFFSAINNNIKKAYYNKVYNDSFIEYNLFLEVFIGGKSRAIPFELESTGNHKLIMLLGYILTACMGGTVIIDEADAGIHDLLFSKLINSCSSLITGQLIISIHNTTLLEEIPMNSVAILDEDDEGQKTVYFINNKGSDRTYKSNNKRKKYLKGDYKGIPDINDLDIQKLLKDLIQKIPNE